MSTFKKNFQGLSAVKGACYQQASKYAKSKGVNMAQIEPYISACFFQSWAVSAIQLAYIFESVRRRLIHSYIVVTLEIVKTINNFQHFFF